MISGNVYPIYQSIATGFLSTDNYMQEISTNVNGNNYSDKMAGYYLGWARPQNLPDAWKFTRPHAVTYAFSDADYGRLEDYRDLPRLSLNPIGNAEQNSDIGYGISGAFAYTGSYWNTYSSENTTGNKETGEYNDFGSNSNAVNNLSGTFGINNIYPEFWGITTVTLRFIIFYSNPLDEPIATRNNFTISQITIPQFRLFKDGSLSYPFNDATYGNITVTGTDFEEGKAHVETSIGNKAIVIFTGVFWGGTYMYRGSPNQVTWTPGVLIHDKTVFKFFDSAINTGDERFVVYNSAGYENSAPYYLGNLASMGVSYNYNGYTVGCGKELDLTIGDIIDIPQGHWTERFDGFIISRGSSGVASGVWIHPYYDLSMVDKVLGFLPKVMQNNSVPSYANLNFAPLVSSSNEFMGSLHTGSTNDPNFRNKLRRWQYIDPENPAPEDNGTENTNGYDMDNSEDKPEFDPDYNPDEPSGGGDAPDIPDAETPLPINPDSRTDTGDVPMNIVLPPGVTAFTTLYALDQQDVNTFGADLWGKIGSKDADAIASFYTVNGNNPDYALANSSIIDYLISLRYYPFDVPNAIGQSTPVNGIRLGSGVAQFSPSCLVLEANTGFISGGKVKIPSGSTFLDLEPFTSINFFVPFCGTLELPASIVMGRTVSLYYWFDLCTGSCTAYLSSVTSDGTQLIGTLNGTIGFDILLTGNNAQTLAARANIANNIWSLNQSQNLTNGIANAIGTLNPLTLGATLVNSGFDYLKQRETQPLLTGVSPLQAGCQSSMAGLGYTQAFVQIRKHPLWNSGKGYDQIGYICDKPLGIGNLTAGTYFQAINPKLTSIPATAAELAQIESTLTSGAIK